MVLAETRFLEGVGRVRFGSSALPPKADICGAQAHVRFGPIADINSVVETSRQQRSTCGHQYVPFRISTLGRVSLRATNWFHYRLQIQVRDGRVRLNTINGGQQDSPFWNPLAAPWLASPFQGRSAAPHNLVRHRL
jgi:hypothetical protein